MKKKALLAILLALVLCLGCVFAVACEDPNNPDDHNGDTGDIPTEDGKVTLYWTVTHDTGLTNITSYFLCGTPNNWTEGDLTYEFKRVGETNTWYVFMDPTLAAGAEYKVLIGYNGDSPVDVANQGPFWANESYGKTWAAGGANSTVPEFAATDKTVNCGEIVFEGCMGEPVPVKNFDVKVSFNSKLGDNAVVFIMGHFSSWNSKIDGPARAVRDEAASGTLDVWKVHVESMFAKEEAEYLVVVFPNGLGETIEDGDIWAYYNAKLGEAIKVCDAGQNAKVAVTGLYENDYLDIANTISAGSKAKGLDLSLAVMGKDEEGNDNGLILDINADVAEVEVVFTLTLTEALPEGKFVYLVGAMNAESWSGELMTASADGKTYTLTRTIKENALGSMEFKVVILDAEKGEAGVWVYPRIVIGLDGAVAIRTAESDGVAEPGNAAVEAAEGTVNLFGSAVTIQ